ncbi:MAG TPA: division/cell wall cluster transcriptional repressor MraZ [Hyphomicrobiaceae bacterium]|nr:division/cell wall cluster transcriptional repressor MraZ [Hyphomicrobiaceae bacterium]
MDRFVSTFTNRIDAKGRVSVPAPFRAVLDRDRYASGGAQGIYCYPSLDTPALDAGGERLARKIDALLGALPDYSDERDELSVALYGDVQVLSIDGDGRIVLPQGLREHAGLLAEVTFVGLGDKFQMWEPKRFDERRLAARAKVHEHRRLFGAGSRQGEPGGSGGDGHSPTTPPGSPSDGGAPER